MIPSDVMSLPSEASAHTHEHHQLVVVLTGNTDFDIRGNNQKLAIGGGCLVPSAESHVFSGSDDNRIMIVNLPIPPYQAITEEEYESVSRLFDHSSYFQLTPRLQLLATVLSSEVEQHPDDSLLARACGNTLLSAIGHQLMSTTSLPDQHYNGRQLDMDKLDQFIEMHLSRRLLINELASFCFLSVSQFHQRFKQKNGMSPHQYLLQKRLARAQTLLTKGHSTSQVVESCGFSSQSAMTTLFSQHFGVSPVRYQKMHCQR